MLCIQSWLIWKRSILISQWMSYIGTQYQMWSMLACHRYIYTYKYNAFFAFLFVKIFFFTFCIRLFHAWIITKSRAFAFDSSYSVWVYDCMMHVWSIYTIIISVYRTYWSRFFFAHFFFVSFTSFRCCVKSIWVDGLTFCCFFFSSNIYYSSHKLYANEDTFNDLNLLICDFHAK